MSWSDHGRTRALATRRSAAWRETVQQRRMRRLEQRFGPLSPRERQILQVIRPLLYAEGWRTGYQTGRSER